MKNTVFFIAALLFVNLSNTHIDPTSIKIGNQTWMVKNLDVNHYRNGDLIREVRNSSEWAKLKTGAWCYYDNIKSNGLKYGKLYNWYAVNDPRGLAPKGWHIASDAEWTRLTDFLEGENIAGRKLKATRGWNEGFNGSNESGFTGYPGGGRYYDGPFYNEGDFGYWWCSTQYFSDESFFRYMGQGGYVSTKHISKVNGFSVRCIKD